MVYRVQRALQPLPRGERGGGKAKT